MKTLWYIFLEIVSPVLLYLPIVFGVSLVSAIVAAKYQYITGEPARILLAYGWKVYILIAIASFVVFTGFIWQDWRVDIRKACRNFFLDIVVHLENFLFAFFWPIGWSIIIGAVSIMELRWTQVVYYAFEYLFVSGWKVPKVETTASE